MNKEDRLQLFEQITIYPVTCEKLSRGRSDIDVLHAVIDGGAKIIQLREKELTKKELYQLAVKFREITAKNKLLLIINDHVDIAIACGADGVHLGQDDLPVHAARSIAPDIIIGVSTHSESEAIAAEKAEADYVNIGPIFPTKTKEKVCDFLGVEKIKEISRNIRIPFTVMGGITLDNIGNVVRAGAKKVAVVSAITAADDMAAATRALREVISGQWSGQPPNPLC